MIHFGSNIARGRRNTLQGKLPRDFQVFDIYNIIRYTQIRLRVQSPLSTFIAEHPTQLHLIWRTARIPPERVHSEAGSTQLRVIGSLG